MCYHDDVINFSALPALCEGKPLVSVGFPHTKTSDAELWCFLWSALEQTAEQTIGTRSLWSHCYVNRFNWYHGWLTLRRCVKIKSLSTPPRGVTYRYNAAGANVWLACTPPEFYIAKMLPMGGPHFYRHISRLKAGLRSRYHWSYSTVRKYSKHYPRTLMNNPRVRHPSVATENIRLGPDLRTVSPYQQQVALQ